MYQKITLISTHCRFHPSRLNIPTISTMNVLSSFPSSYFHGPFYVASIDKHLIFTSVDCVLYCLTSQSLLDRAPHTYELHLETIGVVMAYISAPGGLLKCKTLATSLINLSQLCLQIYSVCIPS